MILPGWYSIDSVSRWHRGFEVAGFVALGFLLLFEILAYFYGNRKDDLLAGQSNQKVSELEKKTAPRAITPEQRTILNNVLGANPKYNVTITCNMGDQEGLKFAQQFIDVFKQNGWLVDGPNQAIYDRAPEGLQLVVKDGKNPPPGADIILNGLRQAHIEFGAFQNPAVAEGIIDFRVGSKP